MSYQIKSTPFFQRILATSKQSGDLQKLKAEYERIKDFNEKAIETKMRQARLKRLFQEIEEIKEATFKRRRLANTPTSSQSKLRFSDDERLFNLSKAKDLGKYYSRLNAPTKRPAGSSNDLQYYRSKAYMNSKQKLTQMQLAAADKLKERMNMRAKYGNDISNWNMHKMLMGKLHNEVNEGIKETAHLKLRHVANNKHKAQQGQQPGQPSETSLDGKEKLKYRINYGNTISDLNMMLMPKRKARSNVSKETIESCSTIKKSERDGTGQISSVLSDTTIRADSEQEKGALPQQQQQQDYLVLDNGALQPLYACDPIAMKKRLRSQKRWNKMFLTLRALIDNKKRSLSELPQEESEEEDQRYKLRSISNDTNLLQASHIPEFCDQLELSETEEDFTTETLINSQDLQNVPPPNNAQLPTSQLPLILQQRLKLKPIPKDEVKVSQTVLMKFYEPHSMQIVNKEIYESGLQKIMDVFEHSNIKA